MLKEVAAVSMLSNPAAPAFIAGAATVVILTASILSQSSLPLSQSSVIAQGEKDVHSMIDQAKRAKTIWEWTPKAIKYPLAAFFVMYAWNTVQNLRGRSTTVHVHPNIIVYLDKQQS